MGIYVVGFDNCKAKAAEAYAGIDLRCIIPNSEMEEEGEDDSVEDGETIEEGAVEEGGVDGGIDEAVMIEAQRAKGESIEISHEVVPWPGFSRSQLPLQKLRNTFSHFYSFICVFSSFLYLDLESGFVRP